MPIAGTGRQVGALFEGSGTEEGLVAVQLEVEDVRRALLSGGPLSDAAFDEIYPLRIQRASGTFWTPLETARRAAALLVGAGARRVLDVGSGVGKFALVAATTTPGLHILGVEQRIELVQVARTARATLRIENASFVHGNVTEMPWFDYGGLYFYNSFAENLFDPSDWLDNRAELSRACFVRDVQRTVAALRAARPGTAVVTYHGASTRVPRSFELHHQEQSGSGWLRLWIKHRVYDDGSFFVEDGEAIISHDASGKQI